MRNLIIWMSIILFLMVLRSYGQEPVYIGMSTDEFKVKLPGILPEDMKYNSVLYFQEKIYNIDGKWTFQINTNNLASACLESKNGINSADEFEKWIVSAKLIIEDYIKIYGQPLKYDIGNNEYLDRKNFEYEKTIGKREIFYEANWKTKTENIKISCDYRSNYYEEFQEGLPNGPNEWFNYSFIIAYSPISETKDMKPEEKGRFYLGMDVSAFAKVFPALFPKGVKITGQWYRDQELYGLSGSWAYQFEDGILKWVLFDKYIDEINDNNFKKCLSATNQLIIDYTKHYGKPDTIITGNTSFIDPFIKSHWGYDVIEARWKNVNGMKIKIEFTFMGGKGDYHFLVKINYFEKSYPYFD